jgi:HSP20 family molecular chaperone IbpA
MRRMSEDMDRMFSGYVESGDGASWMPAVEVTERGNTLVVRADLPGINQNDVKVEVTPEGLTIRGERKREHEERGAWGYRSERTYGSFYRTIPLPEGANVESATAEFKDGVLEVTVPVPEQQRRRWQIPIAGASNERKPILGESAGQKPRNPKRGRQHAAGWRRRRRTSFVFHRGKGSLAQRRNCGSETNRRLRRSF